MIAPMQAADLKARIAEHMGYAHKRFGPAAEQALDKVLSRKDDLQTQDVDAWLEQMWPEGGLHGGSVDPIGAQRALEAFVARPPPTKPSELGGRATKLGLGARLESDNPPWTDKIDTRDVPAKVEAFQVRPPVDCGPRCFHSRRPPCDGRLLWMERARAPEPQRDFVRGRRLQLRDQGRQSPQPPQRTADRGVRGHRPGSARGEGWDVVSAHGRISRRRSRLRPEGMQRSRPSP